MKISPTGNYTKAAETAWQHLAPVHAPQQVQKTAGRFDSVLLSTSETRRDEVRRELHGRITQEVRTATSSGQVLELREQIQNGTYRVEPAEIARKMLLVGVV